MKDILGPISFTDSFLLKANFLALPGMSTQLQLTRSKEKDCYFNATP